MSRTLLAALAAAAGLATASPALAADHAPKQDQQTSKPPPHATAPKLDMTPWHKPAARTGQTGPGLLGAPRHQVRRGIKLNPQPEPPKPQ